MNCAEWEERIALYAGGDLAAAEAAAVELHLAGCSGCREFSGGLRQSMALVAEAGREEIAEGHFAAVRARVMAQVQARRRRRWAWIGGLAATAVAVLAAIVAIRPGRLTELPIVAVRVPPAPLRIAGPLAGARGSVPSTRGPVPSRDRKGAVPPNHAPPQRQLPPPKLVANPEPPQVSEPLVVKLITDDPNVVIYWIADRRGDSDR